MGISETSCSSMGRVGETIGTNSAKPLVLLFSSDVPCMVENGATYKQYVYYTIHRNARGRMNVLPLSRLYNTMSTGISWMGTGQWH